MHTMPKTSLCLMITSLLVTQITACSNIATIAKSTPNVRLDAVNQLYTLTATDEKKYVDACDAEPTPGCGEIVTKAKKADNLAFGALTQANDAYAKGDNTDVALLIGVAEAGVNVFGTYFSN